MPIPITKSVSNEWTYIAPYAGIRTNIYFAFAPERSIEVGFGYAPLGLPRGLRKVLLKPEVITVWGFGSIYARIVDHDGIGQVSVFKNVDLKNLPTDVGF